MGGALKLSLALLALFALTRAQETAIERDCSFTFDPTFRVEGIEDGSSVCIRLADTDPSKANTWHFVACPGNTFSSRGNISYADLCRNYMNESGIGIDFSRGEAAVRRLELMCSSSAGTTQTVVRFSVLIRPDKSIVYVPQSLDGPVRARVGETTVIAQFIGRLSDLQNQVRIPEGVSCSTVRETSNCVFADETTEGEVTMTCTMTPVDEEVPPIEFRTQPDDRLLARVTVQIIPNNTESSDSTNSPTLGAREISGIAIGGAVIVILVIIAILIVVFLIIVWFGGKPKQGLQHGNPENGQVQHMAFSKGIREIVPETVISSIVQSCGAREFKLNGRSVAERFSGDNDKVHFFATPAECSEAVPSPKRNSSLVAQMRHLESLHDDRVHIVEVRNEGGQDVDGTSYAANFIKEAMRQRPAPSIERQLSTSNRILQSLYQMTFQWILDWRRSQAASNSSTAVSNGRIPEENPEDPDAI